MTGPERETLTVLLRYVETIQSDLRDVKDSLTSLDGRVRNIETTSATQIGMAAGAAAVTASNEARAEKRSMSNARLLAVLASVATIAGVIVGLILRVA